MQIQQLIAHDHKEVLYMYLMDTVNFNKNIKMYTSAS
jgi:hypothetical protein